jgi:hypothetical protein
MIVGIVLVSLINIGLFLILLKFIRSFKKIGPSSFFYTLKAGLNERSRCRVSYYYFSYLGIRYLVVFFILCSGLSQHSLAFWIVLVIVQALQILFSNL